MTRFVNERSKYFGEMDVGYSLLSYIVVLLVAFSRCFDRWPTFIYVSIRRYSQVYFASVTKKSGRIVRWNILALFFKYIRDHFKYVSCAPSMKTCRIRKHKMTFSIKRESKIFAISHANFLYAYSQKYQLLGITCWCFDNVSLLPKLFSSRRNSKIRRHGLCSYIQSPALKTSRIEIPNGHFENDNVYGMYDTASTSKNRKKMENFIWHML